MTQQKKLHRLRKEKRLSMHGQNNNNLNMLEVRKNTYTKNYENTFFREFARHLYKSFTNNGRSGLLIGSPFCEVDERLQLDALLITDQVVCIIDFKNFSGKINLPNEKNFEMGMWTNTTGDQIKGGSSINPFIQLKNQKRRFSEVYNKYIQSDLNLGDIFNPNHTVRIICFQEETELKGKIPANEALNFFILNKINFLEGLLDIIDVSDKDVNISPNSYDAFKKVFRADKFKFDDKPFEDKIKVFADKSVTLDNKKLYADQHSALNEIKTFLESSDQQIFVLQGTANSGKSYLIPFIQELAYNLGIQETEIFASSARVANNLLTIGRLERVNSIYSYIYGGQKSNKQDEEQEKENENNEGLEEAIDSEELQVEEIPLKKCDNAENALFIVDESQLVSDSFNQSIDLIFGTGYLLKDFLSFTNIINTKRKIIFIGDPFQLQLGKTDESPLNPLYLEEAYKLKTNAYQLLDKPDFSAINKKALFCVESIRAKYFNSLHFDTNDNFCFLPKGDVLKAVTDVIHNKIDCHILCFSNEKSQEVNYWIKNSIIKNGNDIANGDFILFNNNIETAKENDPFAKPKWIYNGQFGIVDFATSDSYLQETKKIKGELTSIDFREINIVLSDSGDKVKILSLENYRLNPKAELSKNELILFKIILNRELNKAKKNNPFDNSFEYINLKNDTIFNKYEIENNELLSQLIKGTSRKKDLTEEEVYLKTILTKAKYAYKKRIERDLRKNPSSEYYKLKNSALLRFGWAMTVHKSMSYKWQEVIFNVDKPGTTNETHFRWLYTGISRARKKVSLINYKPISPFDNTELIDCNSGIATNEFFYIAESEESGNRLIEFKDFVLSKLIATNTEIERVENLNWQERYHLKRNTKNAIISFSYNGQGKFRFPTFTGGESAIGNEIVEYLKSKNTPFDFCTIKDNWRKNHYETLAKILKQNDIYFSQIIQTAFKDKIKLFNDSSEEIDLEIDYNGDGAFTKITARYYSNSIIWQSIVESLTTIKEANNGF